MPYLPDFDCRQGDAAFRLSFNLLNVSRSGFLITFWINAQSYKGISLIVLNTLFPFSISVIISATRILQIPSIFDIRSGEVSICQAKSLLYLSHFTSQDNSPYRDTIVKSSDSCLSLSKWLNPL